MIDTITFNNKLYPAFQAEGHAAQFAMPFAKHVCKGTGYDVGCNKPEWALPGAVPIDLTFNNGFNAENLPEGEVDYIFSSHCLEHIASDWYGILQYWKSKIKPGGTLFLYLPDYSQEYWRPWNNRKHVHAFTPRIIADAFDALDLSNRFISEIDLNNSFMAMGQV